MTKKGKGSGGTARGPLRRAGVLVALILLVLAVAEAGVRVVDAKLPEPLEWHSFEAQAKAERIEALGERGGAPIVAIGDSTMQFAFDPGEFRTALGRAPLVYNAALPGGSPRVMEIWFDRFAFAELRPKVVIVGVISADLNAGRAQNRFYELFAGSKAAKRLTGRSSVLEQIDRRVGSVSALWRYRSTVRRPVTFVKSVLGDPPPTPADTITPTGFDVSRLDRTVDATPARVEAYVQRNRNVALRNYSVAGPDGVALRRLVERVRAAGSQVVIVEMPIGDYYVRAHPNGERDYAAFREAIARLVRDTGSRFVDASRSVVPTTDYFADFGHLNGKGAKVFSEWLAKQLRAMGVV